MHAAFVPSQRFLATVSAVSPSSQTCPWHAPQTRWARPAARAERAVVVRHCARHTRRLPIRCDRLQPRPTVCSEPGPVAQLELDAHHHQRMQYTLQLFPIIHVTFVPSPRAPHYLHRRSALTARFPCLYVPQYSPQRHLCAQRAPRGFSIAHARTMCGQDGAARQQAGGRVEVVVLTQNAEEVEGGCPAPTYGPPRVNEGKGKALVLEETMDVDVDGAVDVLDIDADERLPSSPPHLFLVLPPPPPRFGS
ncbi:hypothetical protein B0H13DRAFT_145563 [Mycena leptocephala]|nr:hypothetical protein B0H13DRAFT_145563 [Mycena leptocephala]